MSAEKVKQIIQWTFWGLCSVALISIFAFVQAEDKRMNCTSMAIVVHRNPEVENYFVQESQIRQMIASMYGQVENTPARSVDINRLEKLMYANPWVKKAEVFMTINGELNIELEQKEPVLRIINMRGENFYMDSEGNLMPWSARFTPRQLTATGNISETFQRWKRIRMSEIINNDTLKTRTILDDLYNMASFILADEFWTAQVDQIYVNANRELELVPKAGEHKIIFGTDDELAEKFWKLKTFYKEGLNYTGWNKYDTLNLKFKNQVVCSKNESAN